MAMGIGLSLCWFVLAACDCDETKEDQFPGFWVACVGNQPALMSYAGNSATIVSTDPSPSFNPANWDCSHPNSPMYKGSQASVFPTGTPSGPGAQARHRADAAPAPGMGAYLPVLLRALPFIPQIPATSPPQCDSTYPDVLQTVHTNALVTRISTCPFALKASIPVQTRPLQIAITPDGTMALVTSYDNAVNFINLANNTVIYTLVTDDSINPNGIAISPDGSTAYVTNFNAPGQSYIVIDIASRTVTATIPVMLGYPSGATLTPDGAQLWLTSPLEGGVEIYDTATNTRITSLPLGTTTDIAFNSLGTVAYITNDQTTPGVVNAINTATFQTITTYTVGNTPADISMSYGDQFLVVNNSVDGTISVIDLLQNKVSTVAVGASPSGIAWVH
jgi:YVTN family beta-propeller protein